MWSRIAHFILRSRIVLLLIVFVSTLFMGYQATKIELSYEFSKAIPTDNPKYQAYQDFKKKFGEDGNLLVLGMQTDKVFDLGFYNDYSQLISSIEEVDGVEDIISLPTAINLIKDSDSEKLNSTRIFRKAYSRRAELDSAASAFLNLPFYRNIIYNPDTDAWLAGIRINRNVLASSKRIQTVNSITNLSESFASKHGIEFHYSGLPHIRTVLSKRISDEMQWFLLASLVLSSIILLLFFRSLSAVIISLAVVIVGVIFSLGTMVLMGYKITLLTALIPPLVVVIGIPNCIYFLNKYHSSYLDTGDKQQALHVMVARMGIVTLFCNIAAAIGFAVFALTRSEVLREFGLVAGANIMLLFFISLFIIPPILSFLKPPTASQMRYLNNPRLHRWLARLERWSLNHRKLIYLITLLVIVISGIGMTRLKSEGFIVDDIPQKDRIYRDLKFFEKHFEGVMPLEIVIDTKRKYGASRNLNNLLKIDSLASFLESSDVIGKPLHVGQGLKFAKQAFFEGDSTSFTMPSDYDLPALAQYLNPGSDSANQNSFTRLVSSFIDTARQQARISANMADIGSDRLPGLLDTIQTKADSIFDKEKYEVRLTGTSVTFLEGSSYIINGLKESIFWAFALIALCMLYLFKSIRILVCSLVPNLVPLLITAGLMGIMGVRLKPSTVLIFSVALGIAIDVTIRFLVNYKQELPRHQYDISRTVIQTIYGTGISIIYTSLVLIAGFIIFCFSSFGGTQSLGWLTSLTLVTATITNLVLLPALLITLGQRKMTRGREKGSS